MFFFPHKKIINYVDRIYDCHYNECIRFSWHCLLFFPCKSSKTWLTFWIYEPCIITWTSHCLLSLAKTLTLCQKWFLAKRIPTIEYDNENSESKVIVTLHPFHILHLNRTLHVISHSLTYHFACVNFSYFFTVTCSNIRTEKQLYTYAIYAFSRFNRKQPIRIWKITLPLCLHF